METTLVAKARLSSLKTQAELAELLGVTTTTLSKWENDPDHYFTQSRLRAYYDNVGADGRKYLRAYTASFFK